MRTQESVADNYNKVSGLGVFLDGMKTSAKTEARLIKDEISKSSLLSKPFVMAAHGLAAPMEIIFSGFQQLSEHRRTMKMLADAPNASERINTHYSEPPSPD